MFPYLTGPDAGELEEALCAGDFLGVRAKLDAKLAETEDPELRHLRGLVETLFDLHGAVTHLEQAFHSFRQSGRRRSAALVASSLGRTNDFMGNDPMSRGWIARGASLLEADEECVEHGWVLIALVGCNVADAGELAANAERALGLARRLGDVDLESKALADSGLALVSLGRTAAGMSRLDEAMTMLRSGECPNPFVRFCTVCDLITACERAGDLGRAGAWIQTLEKMGIVGPPDRKPSFMFTHCRIAYGVVLCNVGRWSAAETALRVALATADESDVAHEAGSRGALADLLVQQGRLDPAAALLEGHDDRLEALTPLARLHLARGKNDLAAAVARQGLRLLAGDRLRSAPLYLILVDAELRRGNIDAAEEAMSSLVALAAASDLPMTAALAARAKAHVAVRHGDTAAAVAALEEGLRTLANGGWPLVRAALHLDLASIQAERDRGAAVAEARAALAVYQHIDAPSAADEAITLLHELGEKSVVAPRRPGPLDVLSRREREVFDLLAQGLSNADIARRLVVTQKTAEHHVHRILRKLGMRSRAEVAAYAVTLAMPELVSG